ncbi:response regulator [Candidatus Magnetaquicoccus inordinatus]|uniref:response regulator n=1 Tax=Candidatus Magnetaquicoccus inordinatus TaxID=2496818 RepID=UPI00102ACC31|nr:response regulator [Candidatus Magnetaquicoccus inordinatus]
MQTELQHILIVDDEPIYQELLAGLLRHHYRISLAEHGQQALQLCLEQPQPDLILLDIRMPEMDGFELCRRLKENPITRHIPIIFVTGIDETGHEANGFAVGAVDYISKPINPAVLAARLHTHLSLAKQRRQLAQQSQQLEQQVQERTRDLERIQETLRESMGNLLIIPVAPGVFWLQIPEASLYILCGCPSEVVKLLMRKGLNTSAVKKGVAFETGPNAILLSDLLIQNGSFANLAEFPVLQMLYRQGMMIPGHPNNTGIKPLLIGSAEQLQSQLGYIHRGNYGLLSKEEIMATGIDAQSAENMMRIKLKFAFGQIRNPTEFIDTLELDEQEKEIRHGVTIQRIAFNHFRFRYREHQAEVNLNLPPDQTYQAPYPLGYHRLKRYYFAVLHTGVGDGWDPDRPSMSSVLMFQGRIYLIDVVPGISKILNALGIGINELAGVFHTHAHDDHFAGLPELIRTDRRIHYFATPLVRASVAKKFAALLSIEENKFEQFFAIHDLKFDVWNRIDGLDIMPFYSPHPVENNLLLFRALGEDGYRTYAHWADLTSSEVLDKMAGNGPRDLPPSYIAKIKADYHYPADLKKLDIGGGMIHGKAQDFAKDHSKRLILAHLARPLTHEEMTIGSAASFASVDILISGEQDYRRQRIFCYLKELFPEVDDCEIRMLTNGHIVNHNVGAIIRQDTDEDDGYIDLIVAGEYVYREAKSNVCSHLGFGSFMGLRRLYDTVHPDEGVYLADSHASVLRMPIFMFKIFLQENGLSTTFYNALQTIRFLNRTRLFGERLSFAMLFQIAASMHKITLADGAWIATPLNAPTIWIVAQGSVALIDTEDREQEIITSNGFFGEHTYLNLPRPWRFRSKGESQLYQLNWQQMLEAPILHWKLLESCQKRTTLTLA